MLDVTIVLFRPKSEEFRNAVDSLLLNADSVRAVHILVSGTKSEYSGVKLLVSSLKGSIECFVYHRFDNLGFASGHNFLIDSAFRSGASFVLVMNPDVILQPGAIELLTKSARSYTRPVLLGPTLRRASEQGELTEFFDSAGISWTRSGRHFDSLQGRDWEINEGEEEAVSGVTGACLLVSGTAYEEVKRGSGYFFDDLFLAYREDAELGIRARQLGVPSAVVHMDGFGHVRSVRGYKRGNRLADLLGVRNRFLVRWSLGRFRPGIPLVAGARDCVVAFAALLGERSSVPGLRSAFAIRRYARNRGKHWRTQRGSHGQNQQSAVLSDGKHALRR